jgi:hypothetical protein
VLDECFRIEFEFARRRGKPARRSVLIHFGMLGVLALTARELVVQIKQMIPVPSSSSPPLQNGGARAASLVTAAPGFPLFRGYDAEAEGIKC